VHNLEHVEILIEKRRIVMIPQKVRDAINSQIKNEMESFYIYLSMAAYFYASNLEGMAHWMRCQAHEEMIHAMKFFDHINDRGGTVELLDLKQLKKSWSSPLEVWKDTLEHEEFITAKINDIMSIVRETKDYAAEPLLNWFVKEQIEEEANASRVLGDMKLAAESKDALLMLDRELAGRVFPAGSPLDPVAYNVVV
jgi:ferritin